MWKKCKPLLTADRRTKIVFPWLLFSVFLLAVGWSSPVHSAPTGTFPLFTGEIERLTLNNPVDIYSGGKMVVGGHEVILPRNLLIDLPANRLTLQQIFAQAPAACIALGESGLAKADRCNNMGNGANAAIASNVSNAGNDIAGDVFISKGLEILTGQVSYISYTDGYYRLNGKLNDAATGVMVRLNDPTSRHTVQQGLGCAGGPNCSADPRFTLDPDNYVNVFATGYPYCIPSTVTRNFPGLPAVAGIPAILPGISHADANGAGDLLCPLTNRAPGVLNEPPAADSRLFAPVIIGDNVTAKGNFETVNGVRFLSAHTTKVNKALLTRNDPGQPDYLFLDEVFIDGPGFQNQRIRALFIGFTTLSPTDVDFWSIHRDPVNNAIHEFPLASIQGCDIAAGAGKCSNQGVGGIAGANIFSVRYDVDFRLAALGNPPGGARPDASPCSQLINSPRFRVSNPGLCPGGATFANNFGILSPIPHEIQARTGHNLDSPAGSLITLDINGSPATNGQYLFPFGMNLGGIDIPNFFEIDLNLINTPTIFEGIPWNLDRRLSPGGCQNAGGCEAGVAGAFALDPFPFSGLDPRTQAGVPHAAYTDRHYTASPLSDASNRILSYVSGTVCGGNNTVLSLTIATDPPEMEIVPISLLTTACLASASPFAPAAVDDTASTIPGGSVSISVLNNDTAVFGAINPASVMIITAPAHGSATPVTSGGLAGTVTYGANADFSGKDTFTYTVADIFGVGAVSNIATVTVTVLGPPVASPDNVSTNKGVPIVIPVLTNDMAPTGNIDITSVRIKTQGTFGTGVVNINGTITYTPNPGVSQGTDTGLTYTMANTAGARSNIAAVTVTINNVSTVPLALNKVTTPTRVTTQFVTGSVESGIIPAVTVSTAATVGAVTVSGSNWSAQISGMPAGANNITVTAIDATGNTSIATGSIMIIPPDGSFSGTGAVTAADALKALRISVGLVTPTAEDLLRGDCEPLGAPNGVIDSSDALLILRKAVGLVSF